MSEPRVYLTADVVRVVKISVSALKRLKKAGTAPWLVEVLPRIGGDKTKGAVCRYRADLVDRYAAGLWQVPRTFASARARRLLRDGVGA